MHGIGHSEEPRRSYEYKRAEGERHTRAALTFARRRAARLSAERRAAWDELGMRW
ncbi:hypothetical protein [Streptomyces sp. N50]|uniref:hypothetical protein n=1 Tax=Streptomyces sp. N50 TaxID=3081765 RepID=UPI0029621D82|nr:hypothetical protein [Streptomyces sp. N50]WOX16045.1 hypothetical protein R2B38_45120 [Streptomyces sp. N50]